MIDSTIIDEGENYRSELADLRARAEKAEQFREAVMDALVVSHIYVPEHDTNPRKAINDLICWEQKIALDPLVSSDARALIERAVAGCAEDCAIQVAAREKAEQENARLREALAELVRLKNLKDLSDLMLSEFDRSRILREYEDAKPKAWAAARTALGDGVAPLSYPTLKERSSGSSRRVALAPGGAFALLPLEPSIMLNFLLRLRSFFLHKPQVGDVYTPRRRTVLSLTARVVEISNGTVRYAFLHGDNSYIAHCPIGDFHLLYAYSHPFRGVER